VVLVLNELEWEIEAELITGLVLETPCKLELEIEYLASLFYHIPLPT
jgi:hypothetical protein